MEPVTAGGIIYADDINYLINRTVERPQCRLVAQTTQSLNDNTETVILYGTGSEELDTHAMHSTSSNTGRITIPAGYGGWYEAHCILAMAANADYASLETYIRKNGATPIPSRKRIGPNATSSARTIEISTFVYLDPGDYVEQVGLQDDVSGNANSTASNGGSFSCVLELRYDRDAV